MKLKLAQIKRYLKEPYPYYYDSQQRLILLLLFISFLSFCFSYFFQPFVVNVVEHKISLIWILLIHALIPFPIAYIYFSLMNRNIKDDITWTLGKEIFNLSIILLIIGITDFLIRDLIYTNPDNWSFRYFWEEIRNTFLVGFLLLIIVLPLNLERLIHKHVSSIKKLSTNNKQEFNNAIVCIKNLVSNESFELKIKDFLFAKVESNYIEVFTFSSDRNNKILIRMTLKELEEQLRCFSCIYKTHRSYLVNLNAIKSISGNAQGYQLLLKNCSTIIPVSRSNIEDFKAKYSKI
ncbi:LytTR family DNA-binding domain-containing protein [Lutibacter sp. B1]|uniref:LytR/AlgR family response regulator transcription factor n=1 Tax=Lutibacter sp. B1 TaxID=2725996 RepID=UPI0014574E20|nr:LytTR family DNA-binding domain-containing protein [Lutibacter sp. B1]NLP58346.1 LytTR family transcriptional regulator [Lutibacter sp. B1]